MARTYKALALLLTYPSKDLQAVAPAAAAAAAEEGMVPEPVVRALTKLAAEMASGDLYDLQERYVQLFDRTRSLSLNLYEHVHGESRDRGQAMAALLELYRSRGLELSANELPDHLPVFLEFLSLLPDDEAASLLGEAAHVIEAIGERLHKRESPYRAVFGALAAMASAGADSEALAALMAEPDDNPDDLAALDKAWAETAVTFGPSDVGCPSPPPFTGEGGDERPARERRHAIDNGLSIAAKNARAEARAGAQRGGGGGRSTAPSPAPSSASRSPSPVSRGRRESPTPIA